MWTIVVCYCILALMYPSSNTLENDKQMSSVAMDDFYKALRSSFDRRVGPDSESLREVEVGDPQNETIEEVWVSTEGKTKRDESDAEIHPHTQRNDPLGLNSLYPCDKFEETSHTCLNVRQLWTTLTLGIEIGTSSEQQHTNSIRWFRYFKKRGSTTDVKMEFTKDNSPWNINIGGQNKELRISPITEIDFSYNYFVATFESSGPRKRSQKKSIMFIKFVIEPVNIDMGKLYPSEELAVYARAVMELPMKSVALEWSLSDTEFQVQYDLPSNMKINADGSSVIVKEFRTTADKILTCAAFSNKNIFISKRNFLFTKTGEASNLQLYPTIPRLNLKKRKKRELEQNEGFLYEYEDNIPKNTQFYSSKEGDFENRHLRSHNSNNKWFLVHPNYPRGRNTPNSYHSLDSGSFNSNLYKNKNKRNFNAINYPLSQQKEPKTHSFLERRTPQKISFQEKQESPENSNYGQNYHYSSRKERADSLNDDLELINNNNDDDSGYLQEAEFVTQKTPLSWSQLLYNNDFKHGSNDIKSQEDPETYSSLERRTPRKLPFQENQETLEGSDYDQNYRHSARSQHDDVLNGDMELMDDNEDYSGYLQESQFFTREPSVRKSRGEINFLKALMEQNEQLPENTKIKEKIDHADDKPTFEDEESIIIADCKEDAECSIHAVCYKNAKGINFCKCHSKFNGNGIFCWLI